MPTGDVEITVLDGGGAVVVPANTVQVVIGTADAGPTAQVVATRNPNTLVSIFGTGPLVEAAALACLAGATVLAMRAATVTSGAKTALVITRVGTSTSVITATGTPKDSYLVQFLCTVGGTIGTAGIRFKLSLDAGRSYGPELSLGTAVTFAITGTGLTLAFAAGTLDAGDKAQFSTTEPLWDSGAVEACIDAIKVSQYAVAGWGSMHLVGPCDGAHLSTFGTDIQNLTSRFIFTRMMTSLRDAHIPTAWGGAGEDEPTWIAALATDVSAVDAKRILATGGHYNMPTAFPTALCGTPRYRRPLSWALAAREVQIPAKRHAGRVRDGALGNVNVNPTTDPADGFVYHDEFNNPGLEPARICSARTRIGRPGFFISQPLLMSAPGSVFSAIYLGNVIDLACDITHQVGEDEINDDLRLQDNGTLTEQDARAIESAVGGQIDAQMTSKQQISSATVVVDRTKNVAATSEVDFAVTVRARGYVLQENVTVGFANPFAAGG